jgi:hypothetical protein
LGLLVCFLAKKQKLWQTSSITKASAKQSKLFLPLSQIKTLYKVGS